MSKKPYFSIVIPAYNREALLPRALQSVLGQTMQDFELIVVDEGSTDATARVVQDVEDPRVRYIHQENSGAAAARNNGASNATGRYLTFLDSDDEAMPHWLETLRLALESTGAEIVCCGLEKAGDGAEIEKKGRLLLPEELGPMFFNAVGKFTNGGVFAMRTEVFEAVGGYTPELRSGQHTELAMRLIPLARRRGWTIHSVMEPLVRVHVHPGPRIRGNPEAIYLGSSYNLRVHRDLYRRDPRRHAKCQAVAGVSALRIGRYREARHHLLQALLSDPLRLEHWSRLALSLVPSVAHRRWEQATLTASEV